jgi:hypothetical protein
MIEIYKDFLPEDKREAFAAELASYVRLASKEDAVKLVKGNELVQSVFQSELSTMNERYQKKYQEEKLPGIIEDEVKKRNPAKSPLELEMAQLRAELEGTKKEAKRKELAALAIKQAAEKGLPTDLIDRFIGEDEESTAKNIELLGGVFESYRAKAIEKHMSSVAGSGAPPKAGASSKTMSEADFNRLPAKEQVSLMASGISLS